MTANEDFFREKRAAAVFKHGVLKRYPPVFAAKAGSTVLNGRVVFVDGYAGRGEYEDGSPGSPLLLVQAAEFVNKYRNVTGLFVEKNPNHHAHLARLLAERGRGLRHLTLCGDLGERLPEVLAQAREAALFVFLDPFGAALDHDRFGRILLRKDAAPTEVLLHFSVSAIARLGPAVRKVHDQVSPSDDEAKKINRLNRFLGGDWWQPYFADITSVDDLGSATTAALAVSDRYRQIIQKETGFDSVSMPVRMQPDHLPRYVLVLFTRHQEGKWQFADALGKAGLDWHEAWRSAVVAKQRRKREFVGQGSLFDEEIETVFDRVKYRHEEEPKWVAVIERNIRDLLAARGTFRIADHVVEVYGATLGSAWIPHVREAVKNLNSTGVIKNDGKGDDFHRNTLIPTTPS